MVFFFVLSSVIDGFGLELVLILMSVFMVYNRYTSIGFVAVLLMLLRCLVGPGVSS